MCPLSLHERNDLCFNMSLIKGVRSREDSPPWWTLAPAEGPYVASSVTSRVDRTPLRARFDAFQTHDGLAKSNGSTMMPSIRFSNISEPFSMK
jgi:hypothetical protein